MQSKFIVDFDYTKLPKTEILSRYLLYKQYGDIYIILALRYNADKDIYVPETFIVEHSDYYVKNQTIYDILSVKAEKVLKKRKEKQ